MTAPSRSIRGRTSLTQKDRGLDLEESRQGLDVLAVQFALPGQDLGEGGVGETHCGGDIAFIALWVSIRYWSFETPEGYGLGRCCCSNFSTKTASASRYSVSSGVRSIPRSLNRSSIAME